MLELFPDRRAELFGRQTTVDLLVQRDNRPGITGIVAPPLMGKTWILSEVARQLQGDGRTLVGYHEAKGGETSHLLYALVNLYTRWLSNSTFLEQAKVFWGQHQENWISRLGSAFGDLISKAGKGTLSEGLPDLVKGAFDTLVKAQKDLTTGGLELAPLSYERALSLAQLVHTVSDQRLVLILDACEQTLIVQHELAFLQTLLRHLDQWPPIHIFLALRYPDPFRTNSEEPQRNLSKLSEIYPTAVRIELDAMDLQNSSERDRLVTFVRDRVEATRQLADEAILDMVAGFPGVLYRWRQPYSAPLAPSDLQQEATNAHSARYPEIDAFLRELSDSRMTIAAGLAFFPRLDLPRWRLYDSVLTSNPTEVDALIDNRLLIDAPFPTYGHETRHTAARTWFFNHRRPLMRRTAERCIREVASRISGVNSPSFPHFETLRSCIPTALQLEVEPVSECLITAATVAFGDVEGSFSPRFDASWPEAVRHSPFVPLIAQALYNRGVAKAVRGDHSEAIADCSSVIEMASVPIDQKAMALNARAASRASLGDYNNAFADLAAAISLAQAPVAEVARAFHNRGLMKTRCGDFTGAIADHSAAIALLLAPPNLVVAALTNRALAKNRLGHRTESLADFDAAIGFHHAPAADIARAVNDRGLIKSEWGDTEGAIADYSAVIELPFAPYDQVAVALNNRGVKKEHLGDLDGAIADYSAVIEMREAPVEQIAKALNNRGTVKGRRGDNDGAIADHSAVVELPNANSEELGRALNERGVTYSGFGKNDAAIADYSAVLTLPGASAKQLALAYLNRGIVRFKLKDPDGAIADLSASIELPGAPGDLVAMARRLVRNIRGR